MSDNGIDKDSREGHRERLRSRFLLNPSSVTEAELLELLLTYAIPRKDVAPIALTLLTKFGTLSSVLDALKEDLIQIEGVGESAVTFFRVIRAVIHSEKVNSTGIMKRSKEEQQLQLFSAAPADDSSMDNSDQSQQVKERSMRVFANDEMQNALDLLPKAADFDSLESFHNYLTANLPYNSEATRDRRANIILDRFFPTGRINTPLAYYTSNCSTQPDLKAVVFYQTLKAEPIAMRVAEELIWPALPIGRVDREQMREFTLRFLPDLSLSSQKNMLRSIYYAYQFCSVGISVKDTLRFNLRPGTFEGFLYILTSEYPKPGIYTFESMFEGPLHRWLLWDREWLRRQLYNLRDLNIVSKIAEIDAVKQFTIELDQSSALRKYFSEPENIMRVLRENSNADANQTFTTPQGE